MNLIHYNTSKRPQKCYKFTPKAWFKNISKIMYTRIYRDITNKCRKNIYIYNKPWHTMACSIHNFVSIKSSCNPITNLYFCIIVKMRVKTDERHFYIHNVRNLSWGELIYISTFRDMFNAYDLQISLAGSTQVKVVLCITKLALSTQ